MFNLLFKLNYMIISVLVCLDEEATTANGTIQPIAGDVGPPRRCRFVINAEAGKQIQISCSVVNLAGDTSFWRVSPSQISIAKKTKTV